MPPRVPQADQIRCFKSLWEYEAHYTGDSWEGVRHELWSDERTATLRARDDCGGFRIYQAGFSPPQHLERQLEDRRQDTQWRIAKLGFWGALLGGAFGTGIVGLISWLISLKSN